MKVMLRILWAYAQASKYFNHRQNSELDILSTSQISLNMVIFWGHTSYINFKKTDWFTFGCTGSLLLQVGFF